MHGLRSLLLAGVCLALPASLRAASWTDEPAQPPPEAATPPPEAPSSPPEAASPSQAPVPPEPEPTWVPDTIPEPGPPPDVAGEPPPWAPDGLGRAQRPPASRGMLLEVRYGIAGLAVPVQGISVDYTGFQRNYNYTGGGVGPRITLEFWPFYTRFFAVGLGSLLEFDSIGIADGYAYATNVQGGLRLQGGDDAFLSGLLRVEEGFRAAEASQGSNMDANESEASFSGAFTRFAVDARVCVESSKPFVPCRRGVDVGVGYDLLSYATNHGGVFLEAGYWSRHHFGVTAEYGWDYTAGGKLAIPGPPSHGTYGSLAVMFSDAFFNGLPVVMD